MSNKGMAESPLSRRWRDLPLHDFSEARCVGLWWLFDSTNLEDHREAAEICADCPVKVQCGDHFQAVRLASSGVTAGGGPSGTWAGRLISKLGREREAS